MTRPTSPPPGTAPAPAQARGVARDLAAALPATLATAAATWLLLGLPSTYLLVSMALYMGLAALLLARAPNDLPGPGLGPANRITLGRAALSIPLGALCVPPVELDATGAWWVIAVATVAMTLDGVDGRVARATGTRTEFGARFDMELDAALILALSVLVWASGRAGPWVLLIGGMRYLFVAAASQWPALRGPLPERLRRKAVCVAQGVVLLVALGPIVPPSLATAALVGGLVALTYSFAVDVLWLLRAHGRAVLETATSE